MIFMKKLLFILLILISFSSCKSSKSVNSKSKRIKSLSTKVEKIIYNAESYKGVRYKYGGTTKKGMDCSGLIYTAFKEEQLSLPRTTALMSKDGKWIDLKKAKEGDLLFFATQKNNRKINHVGLVVNTKPLRFIHSTSSKGVIVSSLKERYWYFAFVQARRIL
jgi:cell wall-associated NlpC family hydrolase